ncbi:MAG: hypothetical protein ACUVXG_08345 [Anaerolineae bacterium]
MNASRMNDHINILGWLYIGLNTLGILGAVFLFVVVAGAGVLSGDSDAMRITTFIGFLLSAFLTVIFLPGIIGGVGLLKRQAWARFLVLILGFLSLVNIPLGTALGVYTIWALLQEGTAELFSGKSGL